MSIRDSIQKALDSMKKGVLDITNEMQSQETVKTIHVRKERGCTHSTIIINGSYKYKSSDCININIEGDVDTVDTQGSVTCKDVKKNINTQGSVTCENVAGNVNTQGSVKCGDVGGNINTMGSVKCNNVNGSIDTMGRVTINK